MADHDEQVARFVELTQSSPETARATLEASNWQLEDAFNLFYAAPEDAAASTAPRPPAPQVQDEELLDDDDFLAPQQIRQTAPSGHSISGLGRTLGGQTVGESSATPPQMSTPGNRTGQPRRGGMMTLGDLSRSSGGGGGGHGPDNDDDSDEEHGQDMFAGGEKSGLAIENPNAGPSGPGRHVKNILKQAAQGSKARREQVEPEEEDEPPVSRFAGRGQTLGSDDTPSQVVEDPRAQTARKPEKVTRNLFFWKDGFSIEDGPLFRYDDPSNQETLRGIEMGRAPLHLMNVEPGQATDVNVHRKLDENYVAPKKKFTPFSSGGGQRLGAAVPGESSSSASTSAAAAAPAASSSQSAPPRTMNVDDSQPTTGLQIRLGDGTRLVSRFNHTHTVADIYGFVNASNLQSRSRGYVLQTSFPTKELKEMEQTLKEAGLLNAVVIQKWT